MLDTRKALASGLFPIKLRATFQVSEAGKKNWIRKYYPTGCACSSAREFETIFLAKVKLTEPQKAIRSTMFSVLSGAEEICKAHDYVSMELFDRIIGGPGMRTVGGLFDRVIDRFDGAGRIGTRDSYKSAKNNFLQFGGKSLALAEITEEWLDRFTDWMRKSRPRLDKEGAPVLDDNKKPVMIEPASITTIAIYKRNLRRIFNDAIADKLISADLYPFGKRKHAIQESVGGKIYLDKEKRLRVLEFKHKDERVMWALDFWKFSYYCFGMNFADVLRIRRSQIKDGVLYFERNKIKNTVRVLRKVEVPLHQECLDIINRWGERSLDPNGYVFPVLRNDMTPAQVKYKIQDFTDRVNKQLRIVAKDLNFNFKFTSVTARHTFGNTLMEKGYADSEIQESLAHESIRTTQKYKGSFDLDRKRRRVADL